MSSDCFSHCVVLCYKQLLKYSHIPKTSSTVAGMEPSHPGHNNTQQFAPPGVPATAAPERYSQNQVATMHNQSFQQHGNSHAAQSWPTNNAVIYANSIGPTCHTSQPYLGHRVPEVPHGANFVNVRQACPINAANHDGRPAQLAAIPSPEGWPTNYVGGYSNICPSSQFGVEQARPAVPAQHGIAPSGRCKVGVKCQSDYELWLQLQASQGRSSSSLTAEQSNTFFAARSVLHGEQQLRGTPSERPYPHVDSIKRRRLAEQPEQVAPLRPVATPMQAQRQEAPVTYNSDGTFGNGDSRFVEDFSEAELEEIDAVMALDEAKKQASASSGGGGQPQAPLASTAEPEHNYLVTDIESVPIVEVPIAALPSNDPAVENSATLAKAFKNARPFIHETTYMEQLQRTFDYGEPNWVFQIFSLNDSHQQLQELEKLVDPKLLRKLKLWWGRGEDLHSYLYEMLIDRRLWQNQSIVFLDKMMTEMWLTRRQQITHGLSINCNAHWVVILGCSGIAVALLCLLEVVSLIQAKYMQQFRPQILEVWLYEIMPAANRVAQRALNMLAKEVRVVFKGDIEHFPYDVDELLLFPDQVKFICLGSTECNNVSFANRTVLPSGTSGLHGPKSRTYFPWHRGLKKLAEATDPSRMVVMSELPQMKDKVDENLMNKQLGQPVHVEASDWNENASRHRCIRCSPIVKLQKFKPMYIRRARQDTMCDGTRWYPSRQVLDASLVKAPVTLRRYWTRLVVRANIENDQRLSDYERLSLASLKVIDSQGQIKFAGVTFFLHHLGLSETVLAGIALDYPCDLTINDHGVKTTDQSCFPCGLKRFCGKCDAAIQLLGACWHLPSCAEALATFLVPTVLWWQNYPGAAKPEFWEFKEEAHVCDDLCEQRPDKARGASI